MGTRSAIIIQNADGTASGIYCHWDGYLDHVGQVLLRSYQDEAKVRELIALGDMSSIGESIGTKHDFDNCPDGVVNAYGRDRGEVGVEAKKGDTWRKVAKQIGHNGYIYVYDSPSHTWKFARAESDELINLADAKDE